MWYSKPKYHSIYPSTKWNWWKNEYDMLMEKVRSMLSGAALAQEFWVEAVDTACYLVNRSPSLVLFDMTPHEVWFGNNPSLSHLKVFGCGAFVHVPKEKRNMLDNKETSVFSSVTRMEWKDISCGIRWWGKTFIVEIWSLGMSKVILRMKRIQWRKNHRNWCLSWGIRNMI